MSIRTLYVLPPVQFNRTLYVHSDTLCPTPVQFNQTLYVHSDTLCPLGPFEPFGKGVSKVDTMLTLGLF